MCPLHSVTRQHRRYDLARMNQSEIRATQFYLALPSTEGDAVSLAAKMTGWLCDKYSIQFNNQRLPIDTEHQSPDVMLYLVSCHVRMREDA